jgi:hypothetical protein
MLRPGFGCEPVTSDRRVAVYGAIDFEPADCGAELGVTAIGQCHKALVKAVSF